jgi:hypothetical protein
MSQFISIFSLFRKAAITLKYPSIRYTSEDGHKCQFYLATKGYIAIKVNGEYQGKIANPESAMVFYSPDSKLRHELQHFALNPISTAKVNGQKYGHCCFCKQELTNAISVYNGYGPICADNYGLPWEPAPIEAPIVIDSIL